ncbi:hypothetical protein B0H16DRAFT_1801736 [Mycena metata]|uniref:CxC2-like cysteine cluster KDZ transposase-associated domain-containing protein n=1 Tax=Mycena metata TaxID=1033252 RepID=A0AAD7HAT5_9AGAR|nr:hypothetical protein B0H16DRAFT_1801736 [Mycena metata]
MSSSPSPPPAEQQPSAVETPLFLEDDNVVVPTAEATSYAVSSTTVLYNLPDAAKKTVLTGYRLRYLHENMRDFRSRPHAPDERPPHSFTTYDLCCQYFKNLQALHNSNQNQVAVSPSTEDDNEEDDDNEDIPALTPMSPSSSEGAELPALEATEDDNNAEPDDTADAKTDVFADAPPRLSQAPPVSADDATAAGVDGTDGDTWTVMRTQIATGILAARSGPVGERAEVTWCMNLEGEMVEQTRGAPEHMDGEPVETAWSRINPIWSTGQELQPGEQNNAQDVPSGWTDVNTRGPERLIVPAGSTVAPRGPGHELRIIGVRGIREVLCHCRNGKHRGFERRRAYAFLDENGNVVIKKAKALLLDSSEHPWLYTTTPSSSTILLALPMSWLNLSALRAPKRPRRENAGSFEYETRPTETSHDTGFEMSQDGRRGHRTTVNVGLKKRTIKPADLVDSYGDWIPLPGEQGVEEDLREEEGGDGEFNAQSGEKRQRYKSSDEPMALWRRLIQSFLDEFARRHGLADAFDEVACPSCNNAYTRQSRRFRCADCGPSVQCLTCVLQRHSLLPLHRVKEWNGASWTPITLEQLGLVYQLGHGGLPCRRPAIAIRNMVLIGIESIQNVKYRFCGCGRTDDASNLQQFLRSDWYPSSTVDPATCATLGALDLFRILNVVGNITVHDFVGALERQTDPCRVGKVPDERTIRRVWGIRRPGRSGWGYRVEEAPYKAHLKGYVAEKDRDTRMTTGLRASGVGGVVCARHELMRPQGLGDLQKGERYSNMDYILLSAVLGVTALYIAISYDIVCQWKIHFAERMDKMPDRLKLDLALITLLFALPVWHALAHEKECQTENSLTYQVGVGRTDGEGIERTWSVVNPILWATKEMGNGARVDAMENKLDHHNFEKNINQGTTLPRKLIVAVDERDRQVAAFQQVDATVRSESRREWQQKIDDWRADRSKPNPYQMEGGDKSVETEAMIRQSLRKEEVEEAGTGWTKLQGSSVTSFLVTGLQLEDTQRLIRREVRGCPLLVGDQRARVQEMRIAFFTKLAGFRRLQAIYMPAAVSELQAEEDARDGELPPPKAEEVKLYLPSGLSRAQQEDGCRKGLAKMEGRLREGQCADALKQLRGRLHTKKYLLLFREGGGSAGQKASTRAQTLIERVGERVDGAAAKYRRAREALIALRGVSACEAFRELKQSDIELDEEHDVDVTVRKKLGSIGSRSRRAAVSSKKKTFSWIWTADGGPGEDEVALHESVRVEWSKAKARKERWEEEVELLREEMKRVLRFFAVAGAVVGDATRDEEDWRIAAIGGWFGGAAWDTSAATAVRVAMREDELFLQEGMSAFANIADGMQGAAADVVE